MNTLFTTTQNISGKEITYDVSFYEDAYHFGSSDNSIASFSVKRDSDEWIINNKVDDATRNAAINALEDFLLSQH